MTEHPREKPAGRPSDEVPPAPDPLVPDPPASGAVPPLGVPFSGPERLRADSSLRLRWLAVVVAITAVGVVLVSTGRWEVGAVTVGVAMIVGALIRAVVPSRNVGLLKVRTKVVDVSGMLLVGIGIIVMVLSRI